MKALSMDELVAWCKESPSGLSIEPPGYLRYKTPQPFGLRISVPPEAMRIVALSHCLSTIDDAPYYGGILWLTNWDFGTPLIEGCGLKILELMRRGYGIIQSIDNAPAQLFRSDEIMDSQAFLSLAMFWGWDAYFAPHGNRYFAYARQDASLYLVTDEEQVFKGLFTGLAQYHPVVELPSYLRDRSDG